MVIEPLSPQLLPGTTPVKRRECSQLNISPVTTGQAPWTTSRCNRLLRPISSRIAALRKERERKKEQAQKQSLATDKQCEHVQQTCAKLYFEKSSKADNDPDWAPDCGARKRLKRTYSSRDNSKGERHARGGKHSSHYRQLPERTTIQLPPNVTTHNIDKGDLVKDTSSQEPYIPRPVQPLTRPADPESFSVVTQPKYFLGPQGAGPFRKLAQKVSPENWIPINGLYNGLDALLRATSSTEPKKSLGARSLFAACIKKIPQYMAQEQKDIDESEDSDQTEDVTLSVYTELESLGQSENGGWKHLRELVRSHGIAIIREAILDRSISMTVGRGLVILCEHADAIDEAEELVTAMLQASGCLPKPRNTLDLLFDRYYSLATFTLQEFAVRNMRYNFLYNQLTDLFSRENLPLQWISSPDMALIWNTAIVHIAEEGPYTLEAARLLSVTISKSFSYDQGRVDRALALKRKKTVEKPRKRKRMPFSNTECSAPSRSMLNLCSDSEDKATLSDGRKEADVTNSITNLLTVLLTLDHVHHTEQAKVASPKPSVRLFFTTLETSILSMHELSLLGIRNHQSSTPLLRIALTLFARTILSHKQHQGSSSSPEIRTWSLLGILIKDSKIRESMSSALCGMILCHAKAGLETTLAYFQDTQQSLLTQSAYILEDAKSRHFLRKVLVDAAFEFADETKNQRHLTWALELEDAIHEDDEKGTNQAEVRTPLRSSTQNANGYRWEEGISEWIARTPVAKFSHVQINKAVQPLPHIAEPYVAEPPETEESDSPVVLDALGSSPLRTSSFCYVRIEVDRKNSVPSHKCIASRTGHASAHSVEVPPQMLEPTKAPSKTSRTRLTSGRTGDSACSPDDEADELSTAESSQETALPDQEAAAKSRPILLEISNTKRGSVFLRSEGKASVPKPRLRRRIRLCKGPVDVGARRPQLSLRSSWSGVDDGSDDELGC